MSDRSVEAVSVVTGHIYSRDECCRYISRKLGSLEVLDIEKP